MRMIGSLLLAGLLLSSQVFAETLPQRWVSAGGAISEWIVALGGEGKLVGVDTTSLQPDSLRALPSIGYQRALSAEGILALRPDILVGSEEMGPPPVLAQLEASGVRIEHLPATPELAVMQDNVRRLGRWLGAADRAEQLLGDYRERLEQRAEWVARRQATQEKPRVLLLLTHNGGSPMAGGRETLAHWMIERAGGLNLADQAGYKAFAGEAILALNPQVVILADRSLSGAQAVEALLQQNPALRQTQAGRDGRVTVLDPSLLVGGLGPRIPEGVSLLAEAFYPSARVLSE